MNSKSAFDSHPGPTTDGYPEVIEIPLTPQQARAIVKHNTSPAITVMCRGYNEDAEQFTELVWAEDADLEFDDQASYPEFQLWVSL